MTEEEYWEIMGAANATQQLLALVLSTLTEQQAAAMTQRVRYDFSLSDSLGQKTNAIANARGAQNAIEYIESHATAYRLQQN